MRVHRTGEWLITYARRREALLLTAEQVALLDGPVWRGLGLGIQSGSETDVGGGGVHRPGFCVNAMQVTLRYIFCRRASSKLHG
jgi:hypothetical protein